MRGLTDLTVVITGASSGIGWATARAFARHGARVVLAARRRSALEEVAGECAALGAETLIVPTDVTDPGQMQALAEAAAGRFGRIDIWVNNAGIGTVGPFRSAPLAEHAQVVRVNLLGAVHGAYAVLPYFQAQGGRGLIVNVVSIGAYFPTPWAASYAASKFGLMGFTDSLRAELAADSGIEVCGVYPGFVDTPAHHHAGNYTGRSLERMSPPVDPEEVAARIVRLWHHPRRAVAVGVPPGARLAGAMLPDWALRLFGRVSRRALMEKGALADATGGALLAPVAAGTGMRGRWPRRRGANPAVKLAMLAGAAGIAVALLAQPRRRRLR